MTDISMHLVVPDEIPNIARVTGLDETWIWSLYNHDQEFGLVTKLYVLPSEQSRLDEALLKQAFEDGSNYGSVSGPAEEDPAAFAHWYRTYMERLKL